MSAERRQPITLHGVRRMLEGVVPPSLCTIGEDGLPHVSYLSQAEYVDPEHVALTYQFFNTTRKNVLATKRAALAVDDPVSGAGVVMQIEYLRTETEGPIFERLRAKLDGIASHSGMQNVFKLRGADIYLVRSIRRVPGRKEFPSARPRCDLAKATRVLSERMAHCEDLGELLDTTMCGLAELLLIEHAMLWMVEPARDCMVLLASRGYDHSGLGAEIATGDGMVGTAARVGVPIRVGHMTAMQTYGRAARTLAEALGLDAALRDEIPLPGLAEPRSQLAVPLRARGRVLGVLFAESQHDQYFSYDDEDALTTLAGQLAVALALMQGADAEPGAGAGAGAEAERCAGVAAPLCAGRQRLHRRGVRHQGRRRRDPVEAGARVRRRRSHRLQQPRVAAGRRRPAAARRAGQPRGAAVAVAAPVGRAPSTAADREDRARPLPAARRTAARAGRRLART